MRLYPEVSTRWYFTAAMAPAVAAVYYVRSLVVNYPRMPERVAVHFGLDGQPNGWMDRRTWVAVSVVMIGLLDGLLFTTMPGVRNVPTLLYWVVSGMLAGAFGEVNYSAAEGRKYGFRPGLVGGLAALGGGIVVTLVLASWWRAPA